jgi:hypothetical protein
MGEKHVIHHQGSPRCDQSSGLGLLPWIALGVSLVVVIIVYIHVILATLAVLVIVGGLSVLVWKIKKNTIQIGFQNARLNRAHRSVRRAMEREEQVREKTAGFPQVDRDFAMHAAAGRTQAAVTRFNDIRTQLILLVNSNREALENAKRDVLARADRKSSKRLERAVAKLSEAITESKRLAEHLTEIDPKQ